MVKKNAMNYVMKYQCVKTTLLIKKKKKTRIIGKLIQPPKRENSNCILNSFVLTNCQYDMALNDNWLNCLESRNNYHAAK